MYIYVYVYELRICIVTDMVNVKLMTLGNRLYQVVKCLCRYLHCHRQQDAEHTMARWDVRMLMALTWHIVCWLITYER